MTALRRLAAPAATGLISAAVACVAAGTQAASIQSVGEAGATPVPGVYQPFELDQAHAAFPTATVLPDGRVRTMWRHATSHASYDGEILTSVSADTTTWSAPEPAQVDRPGDVRDPHLSTVDQAVWLTYFTRDAAGTPSGAWAAKSTDGGATFGASVRIDPGLPYAAISSPIVKVGSKLMAAYYGRQGTERVDTVWLATSADDGATWASVRLAQALTAGKPYQEPWLVTNGTAVAAIFRDGGWDGLAVRTTTDGTTWGTVHRVLNQATGNSSSVWSTNGTIYTVYRHTVTRDAMLATSTDGGNTFVTQRMVLPKPAGAAKAALGMTYAHPVELGTGYVWCPIGMERAPGDSRLYVGYL